MYRTTFTSTTQGLNFDSFPMRLWAKAKKLGIWNPADINFTQDRADWLGLSAQEQDLLLRLTAQFQAGEESVTYDLLPLLMVMAEQGRIEDEMFLTAYLWEEAKHVEGFGRFLQEVAGVTEDLSPYLTPTYQFLFNEAQPTAMNRLRTDQSPEALAEAGVTYQMITEGVLAETGYHAYYTVLKNNGLMPGMQKLVQNTQRDESRHVAYGIYLLSRLVAEHGDPIWNVIEARMNTLLPHVLTHITETLSGYDPIPFGVTIDDFVLFGMSQFQKRYARIEKARTQPLDAVLDDINTT